MEPPPESSQKTRLPYVAIAATFFASMAVAAVVAHLVSSSGEPMEVKKTSGERYAELVIRLIEIEQRLAELESPTAKFIPLSESIVEPVSGAKENHELQQRIARLEALEQDRQDARRRRAKEVDRFQAQRRAQLAQVAAAAADAILDQTTSEQMKARAWQNMRMNAADVWTDEIIAEAVRIGTTSPDPQLRADIWRQAHANHTHTLLLQPLLQALGNDPDRSVREEAAETLDLYLDQPGVREALQMASQYDDDPGVRMQAATSLGGPQSGY